MSTKLTGPAVFWKSTEPTGWPVKELQLLSRYGEPESPFKKKTMALWFFPL